MRPVIVVLALSILIVGPSVRAQGNLSRYIPSEAELLQVNALAPYLNGRLGEGDGKRLSANLGAPREAVAALSACVLFRHQPETYQEALYDKFAVRDYLRRAAGEYVMIEKGDLIVAAEEIAQRYPTIQDQRLYLLFLYLHFRDTNEWFLAGDQRISAARFFRAAFLAGCLENSGINPERLANAIDRATEAAMLQ